MKQGEYRFFDGDGWGVQKGVNGLTGRTVYWLIFGDQEMHTWCGFFHSKRQLLNDIKFWSRR